jgi:hypothetical protein
MRVADMLSNAQDGQLVSALDFGDCFPDKPVCKRMTIKNVTQV